MPTIGSRAESSAVSENQNNYTRFFPFCQGLFLFFPIFLKKFGQIGWLFHKNIRKLTKAENEIFKPKADPVLEAIALFLKNEKHWEGIASELMTAVPILGDLIPANVLTRRLNVNRTNLYKEYGVCYEPMQRTSDRKPFSLKLVESQ